MGYLIDTARAIQSLIVDKLPESVFNVHHAALRDPWYLGPELARDIDASAGAGEPFLNAIILAPLPAAVEDVDAQHAAQVWRQDWLLYFVYPRTAGTATATEQWAEPLWDILNEYQLQRLGNLVYYDRLDRRRGHCTDFRVVGPPDIYAEAENNILAPLGLACFAQTLRVESVQALDPDRSQR
jgi:hypothetical protein